MEIRECASLLRGRDNFLLITHKRPDGDTLGSAAALCHALRRLGKTAQLFRNSEITDTYRPFVEPYLAPADFVPECSVAVDVADSSMLAPGFSGEVFLKLDHHVPRGELGEHRLIRADRASCGEIVLELIRELCGSVDREEANLLYIAVSTDTGCFCYANTSADTFRAAAELMDAGAELPRLNKLLFRTKSRERLTLEGLIYSSLQSCRNGALNIATVTLDMMERSGATEDDCDDLANLAGQIRGSRVSVTIRELSAQPPRCKVSLRTDGGVDASAVCASFGGGGHRMASGCELPLSPEGTALAIRLAVEDVWA